MITFPAKYYTTLHMDAYPDSVFTTLEQTYLPEFSLTAKIANFEKNMPMISTHKTKVSIQKFELFSSEIINPRAKATKIKIRLNGAMRNAFDFSLTPQLEHLIPALYANIFATSIAGILFEQFAHFDISPTP